MDTELEEFIKSTIQNWEIEKEKYDKLIEGLKINDVSSYLDLKEEILPKDDLTPYASKVWINKIYIAAKNKFQSVEEPTASGADVTTSGASAVLVNATSTVGFFQIDWDNIGHSDVLSQIPLDKKNKILINNLVVDQVLRKLGDDAKSQTFWKRIADQCASKNISFGRKINETYARYALEECVTRLKNRFDYVVRRNTLDKTNTVPAKRTKMSAQHGCKEWSVDKLPEGEDGASLENHRKMLLNIYEQVSRGQWDMAAITNKMTDILYGSIRDCINDDKEDARELASKYPFIKIPSLFLKHYYRLTATDPELQITKFIANQMKNYIEFFTQFSQKHRETATLKAELYRDYTVTDDHLFLLTIHMITYYMNEEKYFNQLLQCVQDPDTIDAVIEQLESLPSTPLIVALGDPVWCATKFCIVVDKFVIARVDSITAAFAMYFASYFVFNAEYATNLNSTLDYIERFMMGIKSNDESSSKMSSKRKQKVRVTSLDDEMASYLTLIQRRRTV